MSKIIVVKSCFECPYAEDGSNGNYCRKSNYKNCTDRRIPDWCPLRPLPELKDDGEIVCYGDGDPITEKLADRLMDFGFNECLYAITGGEE